MPTIPLEEHLGEPVDYYALRQCPPQRPCDKLRCRYHLAVMWKGRNGTVRPKLRFPNVALEELPETCAMDVAGKYGALTLADIALLLNLTQERVRQIEFKALRKLRHEIMDVQQPQIL